MKTLAMTLEQINNELKILDIKKDKIFKQEVKLENIREKKIIEYLKENKILSQIKWKIKIYNGQLILTDTDGMDTQKMLRHSIFEGYYHFDFRITDYITFKNSDADLHIYFSAHNELVIPFIKEWNLKIDIEYMILDTQDEENKLKEELDQIQILKNTIEELSLMFQKDRR